MHGIMSFTSSERKVISGERISFIRSNVRLLRNFPAAVAKRQLQRQLQFLVAYGND